jgi:hypothetical protein
MLHRLSFSSLCLPGFALVAVAVALLGCSSEPGSPDSSGVPDAAEAPDATPLDAAAPFESGALDSGGDGGSTKPDAGEDTAPCPDPDNPIFQSCIPAFIEVCFEPDRSGACTSDDGITTWSDGSRYDTSSSMPGMYGPEDTVPCIGIESSADRIVATRGSDQLIYEPDVDAGVATITCPDGSSFGATFDQVSAFNRCAGLDCPE